MANFKGRKIFLIADNAGYHWGSKARKWLEERSDLIELHFLPPYSPNLNATEFVWKETKKRATHNRFFERRTDLKKAVVRCFTRYRLYPEPLRRLVGFFF